MSDTYLRVFPADPNYAPEQVARERALKFTTKLFPGAVEIKEKLSDHTVFIDPGGNWEGVECPQCAQDLGDWWSSAMDRAWDSKFSDLRVKTPCCGLETALNELHYRWPVGFGRYYISVLYPEHDLDKAELHQLGIAFGARVKQLYAHY